MCENTTPLLKSMILKLDVVYKHREGARLHKNVANEQLKANILVDCPHLLNSTYVTCVDYST